LICGHIAQLPASMILAINKYRVFHLQSIYTAHQRRWRE